MLAAGDGSKATSETPPKGGRTLENIRPDWRLASATSSRAPEATFDPISNSVFSRQTFRAEHELLSGVGKREAEIVIELLMLLYFLASSCESARP